ncbi:phospholipase A1-like [Episyrphus balteatus]|uniref:phospholipase A1-like n=1 Tax=Episyrphus balteatus TaxID=286459 RepID=UPI00248597C5|nr:phospholipase A1-like [Episyrphus balteatus]
MKKYLLPIFFVILYGLIKRCSMIPIDSDESLDEVVWSIPQYDGTARQMTEQQAIRQAMLTEPEHLGSTNSDKVRFYLYTQANPTEPLELDMENLETLYRSTFNFENPTRIMIHGWHDVYDSDMNNLIREALLLNGEKREYNFISVDWSVYSATINYIRSKNDCKTTGKIVAKFIDWMHENAKLSFDTLTLYGHSLGAHVAGFTGKNVKLGRINTIIGLDPAMPLFRIKNPKTRLADTDAEYVESIHTNGGWMGFYQPIGQTAFYPNGGKVQPGCEKDLSGLCSHIRAVELLSEALRMTKENRLLAIACSDFDNIKDASCDDHSAIARLGDPSNANRTKGIYYLKTNSQSPFAIGL